MKKKLLFAGGSYMDISMILAAKQLGYYVITSGFRENDLGHKYSDEYIKCDYSNKEELLKIAIERKIDRIVPCANDFSLISSSYVAKKLNLPGYDDFETTLLLHDKSSFKKLMKKLNLPTPFFQDFGNKKDAIDFLYTVSLPVIIKPVDLSTGYGVSIIDDKKNISKALDLAFTVSRKKRVIIEKYLVGSNHGFSVLLKNQKVVFYFIDEEYYYINRFLVAGVHTLPQISKEVVQNLIGQIEKIAKFLQLQDGIFHLQFILQKENPFIIDVARRAPGDNYVDLVKIATKVDYPLEIVKSFVGLPLAKSYSFKCVEGFFIRHCLMANKNGTYKGYYIDSKLKSYIIFQQKIKEENSYIKNYLKERMEIFIFKFFTKKEFLYYKENIFNYLKAQVV